MLTILDLWGLETFQAKKKKSRGWHKGPELEKGLECLINRAVSIPGVL